MDVRTAQFETGRPAVITGDQALDAASGWIWMDIVAGSDDVDELVESLMSHGLDALSVRDAVDDIDLPKVDDFGDSLLVVLHALADGAVATYEIDCFLVDGGLITVRDRTSPSIEALWAAVQSRAELASGGPDELLGRLADVVTRRVMTVLDAFDERADSLAAMALSADPRLLGEVTAVRSDLASLRRAIHPQREMLDVLRRTNSPLVTDAGRRRFSDVFDTAARVSDGLEAARVALAETLDAYRGAEARTATEVTKVLTVYAAIMFPLSLVVGFFGMNFDNLPLLGRPAGWIVVSVFMGVVAAVSLGVFVSLGWTRRPSGRAAGAVIGHGLVEAARAPAQLVGAVFEISTMPMRAATQRRQRPDA